MLNNVDEIKSRLDIVDIVQEFFPLKQAGANFKANCPFHNEKTPSFMVSKEKQIFHCFGCNTGGDMFTFIQKIEKIDFPEALKILAKKAGVQLEYQDPGTTNLKTRLQDVNREAADWFAAKLREDVGGRALDYLLKIRKVSEATIREFKIGYAPDAWEALSKYLKTRGFADYEIKQSGLAVEKQNGGYYDRFRNRLMIPLMEHHGVIVGFTGRAMSQNETARFDPISQSGQAKYVNTPQTLIFNKSNLLFGLDKAKQDIRQKGEVILVEGQMDAIACHQAGIKNAVAVSGTALTQDHLKILKRYTENVVFCLDTDSAGQTATLRGFDLAWQQGMNIKIMSLPSGYKDPDELIRQDVRLWHQAIGQAQGAMDYFFNQTFLGLDISRVDNKKKAVSHLLALISRLTNPIEQDYYLKQLAGLVGVEENFLREALRKTQKTQRHRFAQANKNTKIQNERGVPQRDEKIRVLSERILALMLAGVTYIEKIANELPVEAMDKSCQDLYRELIIYYTNKDRFKIYQNKLGLNDLKESMQQNRPHLVGLFDIIEILAKDEWGEQDEAAIRSEMIQTIKLLKRDYIQKKQKINQTEIARLESLEHKDQSQENKLQELMREHSRLAEDVRILN